MTPTTAPADATETVPRPGRAAAVQIANRMDRYFARSPGIAGPDAFPQLSDRERNVLALVAAGLSNAEIASRLVLSEKTVRNNVSTVMTKLQVPSRAAAIARARDAGLGTP